MKLKKLLASILCVAMVLSTMSFTVLAADTDIIEVGTGKTYETWSAAVAAAADADGDKTITYHIYGKVEVDKTYWVSPRGTSGATTINFVGMTDDAEICISSSTPTIIATDGVSDMAAINYTDLILSRPNGSWAADFAHANQFFTTWMRGATNGVVTYTGCTFLNGTCANTYNETVYIDCNFKNETSNALWIMGGDVEVVGGTVEAAKGIKTYNDNPATVINADISDVTFDVELTPAVIASAIGDVTLEDIDTTACEYGVIENGVSGGATANVTIDGETPSYVATATNKYGVTIYVTDTSYAEAVVEEANTTTNSNVAKVVGEDGYVTYYTSLHTAISKAQSGEIVEVLKDETYSVWNAIYINENVTINGDNHTITITDQIDSNINGGGMFLKAKKLVINDLKVNLPATPTDEMERLATMYSGELNNVTVTGGSHVVSILGGDSEVVINDCDFSNIGGWAIETEGIGNTALNVSNSTFDKKAVIIRGENNIFEDNTITSTEEIEGVNVLGNATITGNDFGESSLKIDQGRTVTIENNIINNVEFPNWFGVENEDYSALTVNENTLSADAYTTLVTTVPGTADNNTTVKGEGTESNPYLISNLDALKQFRDSVNSGNSYQGQYIKLMNDIDLNNEEWTPIGTLANPFNGMFDGGNHTIKNLFISGEKVNAAKYNYKGLFGYMKGGAASGIKNLTIENASVTGGLYIGAILGRSYTGGIVENCHVKGNIAIDAYSYAGGIVGRHEYSKGNALDGTTKALYNCSVDGETLARTGSYIDVEYAVSYAGGIVGFMAEGDYKVDKCSVKNITISGIYGLGGISGIAHYSNSFTNSSVENVTIISNDNNPDSNRTDNIGLIAGACQGTEKNPAIFSDNTVANTTATANYTDGTTEEITMLFGNNMSGATSVTNYAVEVNGAFYESISDAVQKVTLPATIKLIRDVKETVSLSATVDAITIDLNGKTLNGAILPSTGNITVKNGSIVNEDENVSAIEINEGTLVVENVNIDSERHAVRIDGDVDATINGGVYKVLVNNEVSAHTINVSGSATVIIKNGTFYGPKGTPNGNAMGGSALQSRDTAVVTIEGGNFSGGVNKTITGAAASNISVIGGLFDQDPSAYTAEGYEAVATDESEYLYSVEPLDAPGVKVEFVPTDKPNIYNIVLKSTSYQNIYEFVAAEFVFVNDSKTVGEKEMGYEILGVEGKTVVEQAASDYFDNDQYIIRIPAGEEENRLTGREITIGQVKFIGQATTQFQGNIKFKVDRAEVDATERKTHLGYYYTTDAGTLTIVTGETGYAIDNKVEEIKRDVAVNLAFNHSIDTGNKWSDKQIKVTLKNNFGYNETQSINIKDAKSGVTTFTDVPLGQISVTLTAPGFRTYTYKTVVEETADNGVLVLNFWNDVKRENEDVIEDGKNSMYHNFLVGDIVMDYIVDKYDLAAVTSYYGTYGIGNNEKFLMYDLNRDGDIDIRDVQYVLHTMGN